jgi:hypothetical protein
VRTPKGRQQARGTDSLPLSRADGGTSEKTERKPASEGYSPTVEAEGATSENTRRKPVRVFTNCRGQREGQMRVPKESQRARGTHILSKAEGGTSEHTERKTASEGYPQTVEGRVRDK